MAESAQRETGLPRDPWANRPARLGGPERRSLAPSHWSRVRHTRDRPAVRPERTQCNSVLGRLAPLTVTAIAHPLIRDRRGTVWRETGLLQHSPQIHQDLDVDVLTMRCWEHLSLRAERTLSLPLCS